jgi:hypothetical protein
LSVPLSGQCPPAAQAPAPQTPPAQANLPSGSPVSFSWTASTASGVIGYDVIAGSSAGTSVVCSTAANGTGCTGPTFPNGGGYGWFVRAKFINTTNCAGLDSNVRTFSVGCPAAAPVLQSPANNAINVSTTPTLQWSAVAGASLYQIYFSTSGIAGAGCSGSVVASTTSTSYTIPSALQPNTTYEWKVSAAGPNNCPAVASACGTFKTGGAICTPAGSFSPLSPANGETVETDKPTLTWKPSTGADKYLLHIGLNNPPISQVSDPLLSGSTSSYTVPSSLVAGATYYWYLDAVPACGTTGKTSSPVFTFTVPAACNTNPATTLQSPANNATGISSPVTFKWSAIAKSTGYKLSVNGSVVATTADTETTLVVPDGKVTWYVDTLFRNCPDVRSETFTFTAGKPITCPTGTITLTGPANGVTLSGDNKVTFSWTALSGVTSYRLWVSVDGSAYAQLTRTSDTTATFALPSGSVEWYVEGLTNATANTADCAPVLSAHSKFTITRAVNCDTHKAVTLVSPISGSTTSPVDFTWSSSLDTTATLYRVFVSVNNAAFDDIGVTTATHLRVDVDPGTVTWYVQSFFQGCASLNSARATFTVTASTPACPTTAPVILTPANGTTAGSPVALSWTAVAGADNYRIQMSKDGSDFFILADDIETTNISRNLPPGAYIWFVEAITEECSATRSSRAQFTVSRAATCPTDGAQLVDPPDGATNVASPVRFAWNAAVGAAGYAVIIRHNDGSPTLLEETVRTELQQFLRDGAYEWWVLSFFPGCPSTESAHRRFTIPAAANCDTRRALLVSPPDGATNVVSPVRFGWTRVPDAKQYQVWASVGNAPFSVIGVSNDNFLSAVMPAGNVRWLVQTSFENCPSNLSTLNGFTALATAPECATPTRPDATVIGQVASGAPYTVRWSPVANASHYELQESTAADFAAATTQVVSDVSITLNHTVDKVTRYLYRVRAVSNCNDSHGAFSRVVSLFVIPAQRFTSVEFGTSGKTTQSVKLPGQTPATTFSVAADKPWITVAPSSGTIGPDGVTLTVTSDPAPLNLGSNAATLTVTYGATSGKKGTNAVSSSVPVNVSLVTPVSPTGKNTPLPTSLIIPAVAHAQGANSSMFQSDVRIANVAATVQKYQLFFTLSGTDGTKSGQTTIIQVDPGTQMALDDILTSFFGAGSDGSGAAGVLEIRPLTTTSTSSTGSGTVSVQTVASSKTYNVTTNGTFGQFIPAIPFSQFIGKAADGAAKTFLSLQQIAQSSAYRTNFGLLEAAGEPADVLVHIFDNGGQELASLPMSLQAGEHKQLNGFLATNGITVGDGRIEVEVTSSTGKVSAYASVVDNLTNDPLLVSPVLKGALTAQRYTIPGVADLNNGFASWRSDIRIFNPASTAADVTLAYYPQGGAATPQAVTLSVGAGEVKAIDNALQTLYGLTNSGGALVVSTANNSTLTVTARTYNQTSTGTYGQFIPAVTPLESVGAGERALQILQLESSSAYRTNLGLVETSGAPATFDITVLPEGSKVSAKLTMELAANEFRQISLADFALGTMYNTRVTVKVTSGSGRITAYGSVIDQITQDPTYVPAQ